MCFFGVGFLDWQAHGEAGAGTGLAHSEYGGEDCTQGGGHGAGGGGGEREGGVAEAGSLCLSVRMIGVDFSGGEAMGGVGSTSRGGQFCIHAIGAVVLVTSVT